MSTAVLGINLVEIQQVPKRTVSASRFTKLARSIRGLADKVHKDWESFSDEERTSLKELAYDLIEPSVGKARIVLSAWTSIQVFILRLQGQEQALYDCCDALDELVDNILDAIERESMGASSVVTDTLEELTHNPDTGESVKSEEIGGWLRKLSDKALSEV